MIWIKLHDSIRKGNNRVIRRAHRFVFLELCLEAYELRGRIAIPTGVDVVDAVHDILGGNRREIEEALQIWMTPGGPDEPAALQIDQNGSKRELVVTNWAFWNDRDISTDRVRKHRENKRLRVDETRFNRSNVTVGNGSSEVKGSGEKGREEKNPQTPFGGDEPEEDAPSSPTLPGLSLEPTGNPEPGELPPKRRSEAEDVDDVLRHWAAESYHGRPPKLTTKRRKRVSDRLREGFTVEDLKLACDGAAHDDWLMGRKQGSPGYRDVETILRDAGQVERLRDLAMSNRRSSNRARPYDPNDLERVVKGLPVWAPDPRLGKPLPPDEERAIRIRIAKAFKLMEKPYHLRFAAGGDA